MACRQIVPGRRWCRFRPFLMVLVLAAYLFYQTLMPLRSKRPAIPTSGNGLLLNKAVEMPHQTHQVLARRAAILHIPSSGSGQDLQLYQQILTQNNYRVTVVEDRNFGRVGGDSLDVDLGRWWVLSPHHSPHFACFI
uniref:Uncharacterized protein n=1 Tax=Laticauda laticaudata TaxID=8630 RepID=A0A8C5WYI9_LATLA